MARGAAEVTAIVISCVLGAMIVDFLLPLPATLRLIILVLVALTSGWAVWRFLVNPMRHKLPDEELAAAVDLSFPQLQEGLATICSIESHASNGSDPGSQLMRQHLARHLTRRLRVVDPRRVIQREKMLKRLGIASGALMLALIPAVMWPAAMTGLVQRLVTPFANTGTITNLYFEVPRANRVVAIGSDASFAAIPRWRTGKPGEQPEDVSVELLAENGLRDQILMSWDELQNCFVAVMPGVQQSFQYRIVGGGAETPWYTLTAAEAPKIVFGSLRATPPVYSGRAVEISDGAVGELTVFERSEIEIVLQFSKPIERASLNWIQWQPISTEIAVDEFDDGVDELSRVDRDHPIIVEPTFLAEDRQSAVYQFTALGSGQFEFHVEDDLGLSNPVEPERQLIVIEDSAPQLNVTGIRDATSLRPDDIVPLDCRVSDDIGVDALDLYYRLNDEAERIVPATGFERGARNVDWSFRLDLAELGVEDGTTVAFRVRAADERPIPQPNVVWAGPWKIIAKSDADAIGQQPLDEADQQMIERLKEIEKELAADAAEARDLKNQVWQNWDEQARLKTQQLSEKEQQQGRTLQEISHQVAEHPLMQDQSQALMDIGERVSQDVPNPLNVARDAERSDAANQLQKAATELDRIRDDLNEQIEQIEKIAQIEQELAELNRLALEAENLAKDAASLQEQKETGRPEAGQTQQEFEQQLDETAGRLDGDRQQLQQNLDDLLQRQNELLDAAKRSQQEQLQEIAETAQQLSQQERRVSDGVNEEARDASRDTQSLTNRLQRLRNEVQQLARDTQRKAPDVTQPSPDPLDAAMRELRRGNLAEPQAQIDDVLEQLKDSADQLRKPNQADGGAENESEGNQEDAPTTDPERNALADQADSTAQKLQALNDELAQKTQERVGESGEAADAAPRDSVASQLVDRLAQLEASAEQLSEAVRQEDQHRKGAAQSASQMARQGAEASESARAGQFHRAADQMRRAAQSAQRAAEKFDSGDQSDRPDQLQNLGDEFQQLADTVQQLQENDAAQVETQQKTQQQIADQAAELPEQLNDVAERMQLPSLGMEQQARMAEEARQAAAEASESGQQASQQLSDGQLQQAASTGKQTSSQLNRVAQLAQQAGQSQQDAPPLIPSEVGQNVADALQSLQNAGDQLGQQQSQQSGEQSESGDGQESPGSEQGQGQQGSGQDGSGQQAGDQQGDSPGEQGQPGEGSQSGGQQNGEGTPSGQGQPSESSSGKGQASQQLSDAAKALADAAKNSLPQQFTPGQLSDGGQSDGKSAMGNDGEFDGRNVARSLGSSVLRDWGQLQDELEGELRNDGAEIIDSEYSNLIRRYRRELARAVSETGKADK